MMRLKLDIDGISASHDPASGDWELSIGGDIHTMRSWTWGERTRLIEAACLGDRLDQEAFLSGLVGTLVTPQPPAELRDLTGLAVLRLLDVAEDGDVAPLAETERRVASRYGWLPSQMNGERAGEIDRLAEELTPVAAVPPSDGWTSIRFDDGLA